MHARPGYELADIHTQMDLKKAAMHLKHKQHGWRKMLMFKPTLMDA